tara:strand:+ start:81 stop:503 length:423 start_codon:yes stop_codon:yes gene_type:complete
MQLVSCSVSLQSDIRNTVEKHNISVAEVAVLNMVHGQGACANIKPTKMDKRSHKDEKSFLVEKFRKHASSINEMFPGLNPSLPVSLRDIEIDMDGSDEESPKRTRKKDAPKRAHEPDGTFMADDPATPDVNESIQQELSK